MPEHVFAGVVEQISYVMPSEVEDGGETVKKYKKQK